MAKFIMNKLNNVSFVIPVRIDSSERGRNLDLLLDFLTQFFSSKIYIVEADLNQKYFLKKNFKHVEYTFVKDLNPIFHHTFYLNYLYRFVNSPIIAGWDTDIITFPKQIVDTVYAVETGDTILGLPYNGIMLNTNNLIVDIYKNTRNVEDLARNAPFMSPMYGSLSVGGAFIVNKDEYLNSGGDNEHFSGWGPEDFERVKRIEILYPHLSVYRSSGYLFHFWHPRKLNSRYANNELEIIGKREFAKICALETNELREYVKSWSWIKTF
jgi:predicted glycosyltransferase involved in capsule biosynthesis